MDSRFLEKIIILGKRHFAVASASVCWVGGQFSVNTLFCLFFLPVDSAMR
jgi:hypothetical protein